MGEILSTEEAERAALHERCAQLWESHEALRARLAEVEVERDNLAMFHRDWYANDLPEMQRLAMWLDPDPDLPLPSLHNLVSGAMEREAEVAARLAEVERALRAAERRVKVREDQVGIWKTLLYDRIGNLEERLHHLEAVASNVVLVDDEADLLVPDWRAVVEVLREAIDLLRAVLDKRRQG